MTIDEVLKKMNVNGGVVLQDYWQGLFREVGPGVCYSLVRAWILANRQGKGQEFRDTVVPQNFIEKQESTRRMIENLRATKSQAQSSLNASTTRKVEVHKKAALISERITEKQKEKDKAKDKLFGFVAAKYYEFRIEKLSKVESGATNELSEIDQKIQAAKLKLDDVDQRHKLHNLRRGLLKQEAFDQLTQEPANISTEQTVGIRDVIDLKVETRELFPTPGYYYMSLSNSTGVGSGHALGVAFDVDSQSPEHSTRRFRLLDPNACEFGFDESESMIEGLRSFLIDYLEYLYLEYSRCTTVCFPESTTYTSKKYRRDDDG